MHRCVAESAELEILFRQVFQQIYTPPVSRGATREIDVRLGSRRPLSARTSLSCFMVSPLKLRGGKRRQGHEEGNHAADWCCVGSIAYVCGQAAAATKLLRRGRR